MGEGGFDAVLREVGELGPYQWRILIITCVVAGAVLSYNVSPVFTMASPNHRCQVPGLENDTFASQGPEHERLVNLSIPLDDEGRYDPCHVVTNGSRAACSAWVYDTSVFTSTFVTQFDLVCERKVYRSHTTMMIFPGKFLGAFLSSAGGDYLGRRRMYLVMLIGMTATGIALCFTPSLPALMVLRLLCGATTTGTFLPSYVIPLEMLGPRHRRLTGSKEAVAAVIILASGLAAYFLRGWPSLHVYLLWPCLVLWPGYWFLPESPRWLASKGRLDEAQEIVATMARVNGKASAPTLSAETFQSDAEQTNTRTTPLQLFKVPRLFLRYSGLYLCWILTSMCNYGQSYNVSNMSGDIFVNFVATFGMDVLSSFVFHVFVERLGRRRFTLASVSMGGVVLLLAILPSFLGSYEWLFRVLYFLGRLCVGSGYKGFYVFSPELFPTVMRSFGLGSCSMMARLGGLASPYVADLGTYLDGPLAPVVPQMIFGVAGLVTAAIVFFLPETKGRDLPETVNDAKAFRRKQRTTVREGETAMEPLTLENKIGHLSAPGLT